MYFIHIVRSLGLYSRHVEKPAFLRKMTPFSAPMDPPSFRRGVENFSAMAYHPSFMHIDRSIGLYGRFEYRNNLDCHLYWM